MTVYAWWPGPPVQLLAVWPVGIGHRAELVAVAERLLAEHAQALCYRLTCLSECLWDTYARPASGTDQGDYAELWRREDARGGFELVLPALYVPNLPDGQGVLEISDNPLEDYAHALGRLLSAVGDPALTDAVAAEIGREMRAIEQAERGDLHDRAAQAVVLDRLDVSPAQVEAADRMLAAAPLGPPELLTSVDPAAACVAAAHWLAAAATVVAEATGVAPAQIFANAAPLHPDSMTVPAIVVRGVLTERRSPRVVVHDLLHQAAAAKEGRIPDLPALLTAVSTARRKARQEPEHLRNEVLANLLPQRTTPLDPMRPARSLLEHLLDGIRSCLVVLAEHADEVAASRSGPLVDEFVARVQQTATVRRERLV